MNSQFCQREETEREGTRESNHLFFSNIKLFLEGSLITHNIAEAATALDKFLISVCAHNSYIEFLISMP